MEVDDDSLLQENSSILKYRGLKWTEAVDILHDSCDDENESNSNSEEVAATKCINKTDSSDIKTILEDLEALIEFNPRLSKSPNKENILKDLIFSSQSYEEGVVENIYLLTECVFYLIFSR